MEDVFAESNFDYVIHLAAQAGVRYSINHPMPYIESNIVGFVQLKEKKR
jgi:UDP-glucuronate 4-epimerase